MTCDVERRLTLGLNSRETLCLFNPGVKVFELNGTGVADERVEVFPHGHTPRLCNIRF